MCINKYLIVVGSALIALVLASTSSGADTGDSAPPPSAKATFEPVHWAYSAFFGTGWYHKQDARSVFVLRLPPRQVLRTSKITENGERKLGVEIRYPLSMGFYDVKDLGGIIEDDNFSTVSFVPGV